jgi:uncharacterized protein with beta-barrel porin domain
MILGFRHRGRLLASTALVAANVALTSPAWASCTPAAADNVIATCTGLINNQGNGAPGTSAGSNGYGTGAENNMTVTVVSGASVGGTVNGIAGFNGLGGVISVSNSGFISGGSSGISGYNVTVTTNTGSIDTSIAGIAGISAVNSATVSNSNSGTIQGNGGASGIIVSAGNANVTNSGGIFGGAGNTFGIVGTSVTVVNSNSGVISGGNFGIFALSLGGSSVTNSGTITGAGGTAIQFAGSGGNTLTLAPGSVITGNVVGTGNDIFQLGGSGSATFDASSIGAGVQYRGFSTFNKIGASVWTLTGANAIAMPWTVNAGTLLVNGSMASSTMTVNTGGTLGGSGTVGATQINAGGTFAPGMPGAPGTSMTVNGNLAFQSGAQYVIALNPATSSFANVTGAATLGGATVNAQFAAGSYVAKQYTILTAGSVSGMFNGTVANTNLPSNFQTTLSYSATRAYLNLALNFNPPPPPSPPGPPPPTGLNVNQQNVANALTNFFNTTGGIPMVFGALTPAGLTQASGEPATGSQQATFNAMTQFMGLMTDPFIDGRGGGSNAGPGATPFAEESEDVNAQAAARKRTGSEHDAYAMFSKAPLVQSYDPRWSVWAAGFGGSQTTDGNAVLGSNTATSRIAATAVGADYRFSPNTIAGFALAGGGTNFGIANGLGGGRSDLFQAGAFVRHTAGAAYVTGALAYGWQDVTTDRIVTIAGIDQLQAKFNANAWSGRAEGGYRFATPWMGITPYAAGQFTTFELPAYAEQVIAGANTFALAYGSKSVTDTRSELGLRTDKSFALSNAMLTLRGRFAWAHDYNPDRNIAATFQTLPGASFVVNGAAQARDSALATAAAEMKWINGWSAAATFEGEFSNVTRSYAGKGVVRYAW